MDDPVASEQVSGANQWKSIRESCPAIPLTLLAHDRADPAFGDRLLELFEIAFRLVGIKPGKFRHRLVQAGRVAAITGDRADVAGSGMTFRQEFATNDRIFDERSSFEIGEID